MGGEGEEAEEEMEKKNRGRRRRRRRRRWKVSGMKGTPNMWPPLGARGRRQ